MAGKRPEVQDEVDLVEKRKRQILDAAAAVFARRGYHRARTKEIAQEAGVAEGTIYKYFKNKEELLLILVQRVATESLPRLAILSRGDDLRSLLAALLTDRLEMVDRNRDLFKAVVPEIIGDTKLRQDFLRQAFLPGVSLVLPLLRQSLPEAELRPVNGRVVLPAIASGALGALVVNEFLDLPVGRRLSRKDLVAGLVDLFLSGIQRCETDAPDGSSDHVAAARPRSGA